MKKYGILLALTTSLSLWNCKQDQLDQVLPANAHPSSARVAAEVRPTKQWDLTLGGNGTDEATTAVNWWNGNLVVGGFSNSPSTGDKEYNQSYGGVDFWLAQIKPDGTVSGRQSLGGSGDDVLTAIAMSTDRGLLIGGYSNSPAGLYKTQGKGYMDFYVVKLSAGGMVKWNRTYGGSSMDALSAIVATNDGGFLLAGESASPTSGDKTQPNIFGSWDYWVIKIDANGVKQWDKTIGSRSDDRLTSAVATADGGFLLGGYSGTEGGGGDKTQTGRGNYDYWVVKIDANGAKQWDKVFGGSGEDKLVGLVASPDGGFLLGGSSNSPVSGDVSKAALFSNIGQHDYWVVKIDASGNKQWDKMLNATSDETLGSLAVTSDGGFLLGGTSAGLPERDKTVPQKGLGDYWIVKLDASGTKLWDQVVGGTDNWDHLTNLVTTSDGGIVASGYSSSNAGGDKTDNNRGIWDYWIVKLK